LPDFIVPADEDIIQPDWCYSTAWSSSCLSHWGWRCTNGPILADQDVPVIMPDQDPLPLALIDPAPPDVVVQDSIPDFIPQEPS
jgi:hypothetical protein